MTFREFLLNETKEKQLYTKLIKHFKKEGIIYSEKSNMLGKNPLIQLDDYFISAGGVFHDMYTVLTKNRKELKSFYEIGDMLTYMKELDK